MYFSFCKVTNIVKFIPYMIIGLGINIYSYLLQMGNDPRCMVGWDAEVKMAFFFPVIVLAVLAVVLMTIVHCNIKTPALRKASFIEDQVILNKYNPFKKSVLGSPKFSNKIQNAASVFVYLYSFITSFI